MLIGKFLSGIIIKKIGAGITDVSYVQDSFGFFEENQPNSGCGTVLQFVLSNSLVCLHNGGNYIFEAFFEEILNVVF